MGLIGDSTVPLRKQATREHCSTRLLLEILSNTSTQGNTSYCTSGLWYNKMTRIPAVLLDERAVLLTVEDDERVSGGKALC